MGVLLTFPPESFALKHAASNKFIKEWNENVDSIQKHKKKTLGYESEKALWEEKRKHKNGSEWSEPALPDPLKEYPISSRAGANMFNFLTGGKDHAVTTSPMGYHAFEKGLTEHLEHVCHEFADKPQEKQGCFDFLAHHKKELCRAVPLIRRDSCEDIIQNASKPETAEQPQEIKRHPTLLEKFKFW